jgi:hypothetical protein
MFIALSYCLEPFVNSTLAETRVIFEVGVIFAICDFHLWWCAAARVVSSVNQFGKAIRDLPMGVFHFSKNQVARGKVW